MSEHRGYAERDVLTEPSGEHFTKRGHNVAHLKGQLLEKVKNMDPLVPMSREAIFIKKSLTLSEMGGIRKHEN